MKKATLVYFSATHTTQKIMRAIAEGTGYAVEEYDFTLPKGRENVPAPFGEEDFVIIGTPVYEGLVPAFTTEYLNSLKANRTPCVLVGVYGNRAFEDYLVELEDMMTACGFVPVAAGAFVAEHSFSNQIAGGRPNAEDIALAKEFGRKVAEKMKNGAAPIAKGALPGNRPYQERRAGMPPIAPIVNDNCINCKACAENCPMGAINYDDVKLIDATKCIKCRSCARVCPVAAIDLRQPPFLQIIEYCTNKFGQPAKTPEIFL